MLISRLTKLWTLSLYIEYKVYTYDCEGLFASLPAPTAAPTPTAAR